MATLISGNVNDASQHRMHLKHSLAAMMKPMGGRFGNNLGALLPCVSCLRFADPLKHASMLQCHLSNDTHNAWHVFTLWDQPLPRGIALALVHWTAGSCSPP